MANMNEQSPEAGAEGTVMDSKSLSALGNEISRKVARSWHVVVKGGGTNGGKWKFQYDREKGKKRKGKVEYLEMELDRCR